MRDWGGFSPFIPKILNLTLLLNVTAPLKIESSPLFSCLTLSFPWLPTKYWKKKKSLTDFRLMLPNVLLWVHIFSFIITTYLKNLIGIKLFNTKQRPAKLSPRIMPTRNLHLKNNVHHPSIWLVVITRYGLPSPFLQTLKENAVNEKLIQPRSKN